MMLQMEYAVFEGFGNVLLTWQWAIFEVRNAESDHLFGIVVSISVIQEVPGSIPDYMREVYGLTGSTQPREDN